MVALKTKVKVKLFIFENIFKPESHIWPNVVLFRFHFRNGGDSAHTDGIDGFSGTVK
jgi:hypothetical protein